jgi:hypothetical protein
MRHHSIHLHFFSEGSGDAASCGRVRRIQFEKQVAARGVLLLKASNTIAFFRVRQLELAEQVASDRSILLTASNTIAVSRVSNSSDSVG